MLIDTFLLFDEWDLLACRLYELERVVDAFVAVIGDRTFTGLRRKVGMPLSHDRLFVHHVTLDPTVGAWEREHASRDALHVALDRLGVPDDALVLHGDVDEIPQREHVATLTGTTRFLHRLHYWAVDWECPEPMLGTVAMPLAEIRSFYWMREQRHNDLLPLVASGHHFSWLGPPARRAAKLASFSHTELRATWGPVLERCAREGRFPPPDNRQLTGVKIDESYPAWIRTGLAPAHWYR